MRLGLFLVVSVLAANGCGMQNTATLLTAKRHADGQMTDGRFPQHPDPALTPGELCDEPDSLRHPEKVPYCERDVDSSTKQDIIRTYDRELGFHIGAMERGEFKIDHFIPLCVGGSNGRENLWPQHKTVYEHTDRIEDQVCQLMQRALMKQAEVVQLIRHVKFNLDEAAGVQRDLQDKLDGHKR